ncbi:MAG TPA: carboxypeptidase-like regulatory domain-containing protein, partial [Phototrophicaceae bacterium]|nr:carboxypeptidase-like regulatory domain-containing protein [Phototrophicaceae bacterium]
VTSVAGSVTVALTPPRDPPQVDPVVHVYLMGIVPALTAPDPRKLPRQVMLDYLIAVRGSDPERAHKLLGTLVLAALDSTEFTLNYDPLPVETWLAFGTEPQPAFVLRVPLVRERPAADVQLVRQPMVLREASIASLQGVVLGPKDLPLAGVLVELPGLRQYQRTDAQGHFRFPTVPLDPPVKSLRVSGKGHELDVSIESVASPLVIHLFEE